MGIINGMVHDRRSDTQQFDLALLCMLLMLFAALLFAMTRDTVKPEVITVLGSGIGVVLGYFGSAVQSRWGAPKKVEPQVPPGGSVDTVTATHVNSTGAQPQTQEPKP